MNRIEFAVAAGYPAYLDDMSRANCKDAGKAGHLHCGLCEHGVPKFIWCVDCREVLGKKGEI